MKWKNRHPSKRSAAAHLLYSSDSRCGDGEQVPVPPPPQRANGITGFLHAAWNRGWLLGLLLIAATILAYWPALHGGFLWDDDSHISANNTLSSPTGLQDIWLKLGATMQYYPLTFTLFWIGYHL